MSFQILSLPADPFRVLYRMDAAQLAAQGVLRMVANRLGFVRHLDFSLQIAFLRDRDGKE
jgi:hypothetical protein